MRILAQLALVSLTATIAAADDVHPIVEVGTGYLFGGSSKGKWLKAEQAIKSIKPGTAYSVYTLTDRIGATKGGKPRSVDEPCPETQMVKLSPKIEHGVIALAAPWNALPRKTQVVDPTQEVYVNAVRDFLVEQGIGDPKIKIKRIVRVDLEGDGEEEVLISATNYFVEDGELPMSFPEVGSYSIVLLRRVVAGKVQTQIVAGDIYPKPDSQNTLNVYDFTAVLDLNGDSKLEVVVHSQYYEGGATTIYRCEPGKITELLSQFARSLATLWSEWKREAAFRPMIRGRMGMQPINANLGNTSQDQ